MLLLAFSIAAQPYAIPAQDVTEVVPAVPLHEDPGQLPTLNYRGGMVPVLDLRHRYLGEPTNLCLATRIVLVGKSGQPPIVGLLAEQVTDMVRARTLSAPSAPPTTTLIPTRCARDEQGGVHYLLDLDRIVADARSATVPLEAKGG